MAALTGGSNLAVRKPDLESLEIVNASQLYQNGLVALLAGEIKAYAGAAGEAPIGITQETVLGDNASPAKRAMVDVGRKVLKNVPVAGVSAITSVGEIAYLNTDNLAADLTLTRPARGVPIGFISRWYSGDDCDVSLFSWSELVLAGMAGSGEVLQCLGAIDFGATTGDGFKLTIPGRYRVKNIYAVVNDSWAGGTTVVITFKKDATVFTAGGVLTIATDAVGTRLDATAITQDAAATFSEDNVLTGAVAVTGAYTAGAANVYATLVRLPGA